MGEEIDIDKISWGGGKLILCIINSFSVPTACTCAGSLDGTAVSGQECKAHMGND